MRIEYGYPMTTISSGRRRATNVSLDTALLKEAKALKVNISRACERGLAQEVAAARQTRWLEDNAAALDGVNAFVEQHGLPLARHRKF